MRTMHVTGACLCGAIRIEAEIEPDKVALCHCADCQVLSGSAFRGAVGALRRTIKVSGEPRVYLKTAESGTRRAQAFCGECGTALWADDEEGRAPYVSLRLGFLDQRARLAPQAQIWRRSALPWTDRIGSIPSLPKGFPGV